MHTIDTGLNWDYCRCMTSESWNSLVNDTFLRLRVVFSFGGEIMVFINIGKPTDLSPIRKLKTGHWIIG